MKFRLKPNTSVLVVGKDWVRRGTVFEAEWTPGYPRRDPRHVRLYSPSDPPDHVDLPITMLEEVKERDSTNGAQFLPYYP